MFLDNLWFILDFKSASQAIQISSFSFCLLPTDWHFCILVSANTLPVVVLRLAFLIWCGLVLTGSSSGVHLGMAVSLPEVWPHRLYGSLNCNAVQGKTSNSKVIPSIIFKMLWNFKKKWGKKLVSVRPYRIKWPQPAKPLLSGNFINIMVKLIWQRESKGCKGCSQSTVSSTVERHLLLLHCIVFWVVIWDINAACCLH